METEERKPFCKMDAADVQQYTRRLARSARRTLLLTPDEELLYRQVLVSAIGYFNERDEAYIEQMRYLEEMRKIKERLQKIAKT